jgi:hypothetical protein
MKVYGYILINSAGYDDGKESYVKLFKDKYAALDEAYQSYRVECEKAIEENMLEAKTFHAMGAVKFEECLESDVIVVLQLIDSHKQWEWIEQNI